MTSHSILAAVSSLSLLLVVVSFAFVAWRRYLWILRNPAGVQEDRCPFSLTEVFSNRHLAGVPQQKGVQWLHEVFERSARRYPDLPALEIPQAGESLTFKELDSRAEQVAAALAPFLTGPDQVVAVAMPQNSWHIVASHLGVLKAGGAVVTVDTTLPDHLLRHVLEDAQPVVVLTRGEEFFRGLPTLDVLRLPDNSLSRETPSWLDDPTQRLAAIFYTSGTTGKPKGVECPHAGYVNLALSYADYFDLVAGVDATTLTSSLGYDGSVSETYCAWVAGCAVVMLTKEQVRSGPDLLPVLQEAEVTVLFCPPALLGTLTSSPENDLPYPLCRYIVPAGEAFPQSLVEPWTRGRRQIINTYGPTEASTDTSRQSLRPGEPVTIGTPLANVTYVVLEHASLEPLPIGQTGELCIGGVHVARGYRNLPAENAEKFITHPQFGRLYRTGDVCRIDADTRRVHFLGRVDAQLKVRGHRVEVQPVEDILQAQFVEIEAAVLDYQKEELVAFVAAPTLVTESVGKAIPAPADWADRVKAVLAEQLPEPSVPTRFFIVDRFHMMPLSGKIDRSRLPELSALPAASADRQHSAHEAVHEGLPTGAHTSEILAICKDVFEAELGWDDAFAEHGGHSIVIARLVARLRAAGWSLTVRELLSECDTPRKVARCSRLIRPDLSSQAGPASEPDRSSRNGPASRVMSVGLFTVLQALFLLLLYAPLLAGLLGLVALPGTGELFMTAGVWDFVAIACVSYVVALTTPFMGLLWVSLIRLATSGLRSRNGVLPGVYPKWSRVHLRVWCIERQQQFVLRPLRAMFHGASLSAFVLRRLGVDGDPDFHCAHDVEFSGPLDLLTIEQGVTIQTGAFVSLSSWVNGALRVGPICLSSGSKIGMRAAVSSDVTIGNGSWITPFTIIDRNVGPHELWEGAPARFSGRHTELRRAATTCRDDFSSWGAESLNTLLHVCLELCLLVVPTALVAWIVTGIFPTAEPDVAGNYFESTPVGEIVWNMGLYTFNATWAGVVLTSVLSCLFLRFTAFSPGIYPLRSLRGAILLYRVKKMNQIQRIWTWSVVGQYLRALAGMRFSRLGASECDVMFNLVPEQVNADARVFWSHGCFTNMLEYDARTVTLRRLNMPEKFFSSNNSVAESGKLPGNFLLGVSTPANDVWFREQMHSRTDPPVTVAGNPPVRFASTESENDQQALPTFPLFLTRIMLNDLVGAGILRIVPALVYVLLFTAFARLGVDTVVGALLALVLTEFLLVVTCVVIKKILVGNSWGSEHSAPFWSMRHFTYFFTQDCFFAWCKMPLTLFSGTLLANSILRWMGCTVGKRTIFVAPLQAFDWNAVCFGDDCVVAGLLQYHTMENMRLKVKRTVIQDGCVINFGATVMGGVSVGAGTTIMPLALVLKEMQLPSGNYAGSPVEPAYAAQALQQLPASENVAKENLSSPDSERIALNRDRQGGRS